MEKELNIKEYKKRLSNGLNFYSKFYIVNNSKINLLIIPDLSECIQIYENFIKLLNDNGISVIIFDLLGHGLSDGKRGRIIDLHIFYEILNNIFSIMDTKNGIHIFLSGISAPFFLNLILSRFNKIWIRSIFISGYNFYLNYSFFINNIISSIFSFNFTFNLYPYIEDKVKEKTSFNKILASIDFIYHCSFGLVFNFISNHRKALKRYLIKPIPLLIATGLRQKAFNNKKCILNSLRKKYPIKIYNFDSGHSIHLCNEKEKENFIKFYLDFLNFC